jgi:hypothetical protein
MLSFYNFFDSTNFALHRFNRTTLTKSERNIYYFKELNNLPMSTTWVFVGLLCGRELAISTMNKEYKFKYVFPIIGKDFIKMIFGLSVSVGIVLAIHYIIIPSGFGL